MSRRGREFVTTDESTVVTEPLLDPIVVENGQSDGRLADSASADEGDRNKVLSEIDNLLDELVAPEEGSWGQRRSFSGYARPRCKMISPSVA
jgi:hypothetical protein